MKPNHMATIYDFPVPAKKTKEPPRDPMTLADIAIVFAAILVPWGVAIWAFL